MIDSWRLTNREPLAFLRRTLSVWVLAAVVSEVVLAQLPLGTVVGVEFWSNPWLRVFTIYGVTVWEPSVAYVLAPGAHLDATHFYYNLAGLLVFGTVVALAHDGRTVYATVLGGFTAGTIGFSILYTTGWLEGMAALGASAGVYSLVGCLAVTTQLAPERLPGGAVWGSSRLGRAWPGLCFGLLLGVEVAGVFGLPPTGVLGLATGGSEVHVLGFLTGASLGLPRMWSLPEPETGLFARLRPLWTRTESSPTHAAGTAVVTAKRRPRGGGRGTRPPRSGYSVCRRGRAGT